ncbi:MAG: hypothetical protein AB7S92_10325 [Parvibaculaceae bacterium]
MSKIHKIHAVGAPRLGADIVFLAASVLCIPAKGGLIADTGKA